MTVSSRRVGGCGEGRVDDEVDGDDVEDRVGQAGELGEQAATGAQRAVQEIHCDLIFARVVGAFEGSQHGRRVVRVGHEVDFTIADFVAELVGDEDLHNAVALNSTSFNAARMIGPAVSGLAQATSC